MYKSGFPAHTHTHGEKEREERGGEGEGWTEKSQGGAAKPVSWYTRVADIAAWANGDEIGFRIMQETLKGECEGLDTKTCDVEVRL